MDLVLTKDDNQYNNNNVPGGTQQEDQSANEVLYMDIWLKIFHLFKLRDVVPLRRVCQPWNQMIETHVLKPRKELIICLVHYCTNKFFRKEHISDCYYVKNYRQLLPVLEHHQELLQTLKVFNFLLGQWFLQINFASLNSVTFVDCTFSISIGSLADHLKNITRLEIINSEITDEQIRIIGHSMPKLEHLNVGFNNQLTGTHLDCLSCAIKSLNLSSCLRLNDYKLCYSLQELLTKGAKLESLNLKPLNSLNKLPFTSAFVFTSLDQLKVLKQNCIPDLTLIENSSPVTTEIEKLTLFGRYEPKSERPQVACDHFLKWLFPSQYQRLGLKHLTLVDFDDKHTTDEGILQCLYSCPNVTHLKLNNLPFLTTKSLEFIAELKQLKCIKFVNINLHDRNVISILKQCTELRILVIDFLDNGIAKPYNLTEAIIHECIYLCHSNPHRNLKVKITKSLLPTHKLFTIPKNLSLEIIRSRFLVRKQAIYVDEPVQM